jgi:hypothetical protein
MGRYGNLKMQVSKIIYSTHNLKFNLQILKSSNLKTCKPQIQKK